VAALDLAPRRVRVTTPSVVRAWVARPVFPARRVPTRARCRSVPRGPVDLVDPVAGARVVPVDPVDPVGPGAAVDRVAREPGRVLADRVDPVVVGPVVVGPEVPVGPEAPAGRVVPAVPGGRVVPAVAAVAVVAGSTAPVAAGTRQVPSASRVVVLRVDASPSAPSAKNSTTWKRPPSVVFGCPAAAVRPCACRAVLR